MSLLPQRKKDPAEIAQLRESLGIPGGPAAELPTPAAELPAILTEITAPTTGDLTDIPQLAPLPVHHDPKPVHSLKRSERTPPLPCDELDHVAEPAPVLAPPPAAPKLVRSLRKSEQIPLPAVPPHPPAADSRLPSHRHQGPELDAIRRREALAALATVTHPQLAAAHRGLLALGYLCALASAGSIAFYQITVPAAAAALALLIATFIALRRPFSRPHAAFIAVIILLVIAFGALHYFPQLAHAT